MALSTITAVAAAASAANSYTSGKRQAASARDAAASAQAQGAAESAANAQAASNATRLAQAQDAAKRNEELAASQMDDTPTVTTADGNEANRLRKVKAAFNIDSGTGAGGSGSIRV